MEFDHSIDTIIPDLVTDPLKIGGTGGLQIPSGTTAERPPAADGLFRFNTDTQLYEFCNNTVWSSVSSSNGGTIGSSWKFNSSVSAADPGSKYFSCNNATPASITELYINESTNSGGDAAVILSFLTSGNRLYIQQRDDAARAGLFEISGTPTDNGSWWTIPVTVVSSSLIFQNNQDCGIMFLMTSTGGGSGTVTSVSITTANGVSGTVATATTTPAITLTLGDITPTTINIGGATELTTNYDLNLQYNVNDYAGSLVKNVSSGTSAASEWIAVADTGSATAKYLTMGINSSGYTDPLYNIGGALSGYIIGNGGNLTIGTGSAHNLVFFTGGTLTANNRGGISSTGQWNINGKNITLGGALTTAGAFTTTFTMTNNTTVTFPITGTLYGTRTGSITSAQLAASLTNETGTGSAVFATSPTLVTPLLGTPTSGVLTNCTGTAAGLTAGTVTTNANLTGPITSVGNATSVTANAITNAMLAQVATATLKGRTTAATGNVEDLTTTQATALLDTMVGDSGAGGTKGLVPAPAIGDATKVLSGAGTWVVASTGTVTSASVVSANGFAGTVATASTTPAITLTTTITGLLKGNGTAISAASAGTDYLSVLSGDVTTSGNTATLANIPSGVTMAGSLLATAIAAPATPAAGKGSIYIDSTSKNISVKDDAGVIKHGIQTKAAVANSFVTAIDDAGVVTVAQPAFTNISGSVASTQMPALTGDVTTTAGTVATTIGTNKVTDAMLDQVATATFKGRTTAATGNVETLTATQATALLDTMVGDSGAGGTKGLVPAPAIGDATKVLSGAGTWVAAGGSGTVTSVSVTTANGVSGTVANATTTPAISLTLGDITPSRIKVGGHGTETAGISIGGTVYTPVLSVSTINGTNNADLLLHQHSTTLGSAIGMMRSNSNTSAHTAVTNGMPLGTIYAGGTVVNGSADYRIFGNVNLGADDTGAISATSAPGKFELNLCPDGSLTTNRVFKINGAGNAIILNTLTVGASPLNLPDFVGQFTSSVNSYSQLSIQNKSAGTAASSDVVLTTNTGSDTAEFLDIGINGSGWTGTEFGVAKDGYLYVEGGASGIGNLEIGTIQPNTKVKFSVGVGGDNATAGILELTAPKATVSNILTIKQSMSLGTTSTATAAGTTTLTSTSTYHQIFTGTTTQTVVLPNATTLDLGHTYEIDNNSTGVVTVKANGGAQIFQLSPGTQVNLHVTNVGTAAGTWTSSFSGFYAQTYDTTTDYTITNTAYTAVNAAVRVTIASAGTYVITCIAQISNSGNNVDGYLAIYAGTAGATTIVPGSEIPGRYTQQSGLSASYTYELPCTLVSGPVTLTAGQIVEPKVKSSSGSVTVYQTKIIATRVA